MISTLLEILLWSLIATCIALFVVKCSSDSKRETISLWKDEWSCTADHQKKVMVMTGKTSMLQPRTVCDVYTRVK